VVAVGSKVKEEGFFKVGDNVYGNKGVLPIHKLPHAGALAEFGELNYKMVCHMPKDMSFAKAASLPLVSLTVGVIFEFLEPCLVKLHETEPKDKQLTVVVNGSSGGVGMQVMCWLKYLLGVTFAKKFDLTEAELKKRFRLLCVCSGSKAEVVKKAGGPCVEICDYKKQKFEDMLAVDEKRGRKLADAYVHISSESPAVPWKVIKGQQLSHADGVFVTTNCVDMSFAIGANMIWQELSQHAKCAFQRKILRCDQAAYCFADMGTSVDEGGLNGLQKVKTMVETLGESEWEIPELHFYPPSDVSKAFANILKGGAGKYVIDTTQFGK